MLANPNKYIRQKYLSLLQGEGLTTYDKRVPIDVTPPNPYILISNQTKVEINRNKCDKQWDVTTQVDLYYRQIRGVNDSEVLDDLEETVSELIHPTVTTDIEFENFKTYNTYTEQSIDAPQETATETLLHRVLRFRHIVGELVTESRLFFRWGYSSTMPDPLTAHFQYHEVFEEGATAFPLPFPVAANADYWIIEGAYGQHELSNWISTAFNYGTFGDLVFQTPIFVNNRYYYITRTENNYLQTGYETITLS